LQHLGDQSRRTPSVEQDVMMGPDQPVTIVSQTDQPDPLQGRPRQIKAFDPFLP
jgi:hypothetical protein